MFEMKMGIVGLPNVGKALF